MWLCATLLIVLGVTAMWMTVQVLQPPASMVATDSTKLKDNRLYAAEELVFTEVYAEKGDTVYVLAHTTVDEQTPLILSVRMDAASATAQACQEALEKGPMTTAAYVLSDGQLADELVDAGYSAKGRALAETLADGDVDAVFSIKDFLYVCDLQEDYKPYATTTGGLYAVLGGIMLACAAALIVITVVQIKRERSRGGMSMTNPLRPAPPSLLKKKK